MNTFFQKNFSSRITRDQAWHTVLREVIIMDNRKFNNPENKNQQNGQNKNQQGGQNKKDQCPDNKKNSSNPENKNHTRGY
mgnify:CR=1 FL=1